MGCGSSKGTASAYPWTRLQKPGEGGMPLRQYNQHRGTSAATHPQLPTLQAATCQAPRLGCVGAPVPSSGSAARTQPSAASPATQGAWPKRIERKDLDFTVFIVRHPMGHIGLGDGVN